MAYDLSERAENDIITLAADCNIEKVILFGSRARGTNRERSDIDLAVKGGDLIRFRLDIDEKVHTLLMFDVVDLDSDISDELRLEIEKDGVILYEKI